jgi:hypothetical protein
MKTAIPSHLTEIVTRSMISRNLKQNWSVERDNSRVMMFAPSTANHSVDRIEVTMTPTGFGAVASMTLMRGNKATKWNSMLVGSVDHVRVQNVFGNRLDALLLEGA